MLLYVVSSVLVSIVFTILSMISFYLVVKSQVQVPKDMTWISVTAEIEEIKDLFKVILNYLSYI